MSESRLMPGVRQLWTTRNIYKQHNVTSYIIEHMKLQKVIAVSALAALPFMAAARPASPELMRHVNPDGKVVEYRLHGSEHFSYITDSEGVNILEFDGGSLIPAMRAGKALRAVESDLTLLRAEQPVFEAPSRNVNRMAALESVGENRGRTTFPTIGEVRSCVILLEYPDRPYFLENPREQFNRLCNEEGYSDFNSVGSARDYFKAASNGKFAPQFDVYGPVRLEHDAAYYTGADDPTLISSGKSGRFGVAIAEAIQALDDEVDFSVYDYDKDGVIDNIFFFYSGAGQADTGDNTCVWPHQSDYRRYTASYGCKLNCPELNPDGVSLQCYACSCELNSSYRIPDEDKPWLDGIGAFCHEFGHVLGLPDLYDTGNTNCKTPGKYSIMDNGSYNKLSTCPPTYSAYEQWVCRWLDYMDVEEKGEGKTFSLNPLCDENRNAVRIRIRKPGGAVSYYPEYYVVESRGNNLWDSTLPEHGMLIWRIDFNMSAWVANQVNVRTPRVELIGPEDGITAWPGEWEDYTYISPDMRVLSPECVRGALGCTLTNIAYDYDSGVTDFEYNVYLPDQRAPMLGEAPTVDKAHREVLLKWSAVPDVQGYALTVRRTDTNGRIFTVDGLEETNVGMVNEYTVRNITANQWTQTFDAHVRVFNGVPGAVTSNKITFVPAQLENNAVEGVTSDLSMIYGGKGYISAPEGARVYNTAGAECGTENLPAGVYIVVTPEATAKVQVR